MFWSRLWFEKVEEVTIVGDCFFWTNRLHLLYMEAFGVW